MSEDRPVPKPDFTMPQIDPPDAIQWLNTCTFRAMGSDPVIDRFPLASAYGEPKVLLAENIEGRRFLLSATSPDVFRRIHIPRRWAWPFSHFNQPSSNLHPLVPLSHNVEIYQLSALTCGIDFEYNAMKVWKRLTGKVLLGKDLWLYVLPRSNG
jgi:hypothetical protein